MKRFIIILISVVLTAGVMYAQEQSKQTVKVYCDVECIVYNISKDDINAIVDFGTAEQGKDSRVWIFNSSNGKKYSFASPMSLLAYMSKHGWNYVDTYIVNVSTVLKNRHFILSKDVPADYTAEDVVGDINYRQY